MKVKEALKRQENLKQLLNNLRLIQQYFLNEQDSNLEKIADRYGMNSTINKTMKDAVDELYALTSKYEKAIQDSEIKDVIIL